VKQDIKDFVSQKRRSKYHTVNNFIPGFLDVENANLFVMYVKARFLIKFEQTKSYMVPIFYLIISSFSMIDLIQLLNLISKVHYITKISCSLCKLPSTTSPRRPDFDGFHSIRFSRCIHKIDHNSLN
jgi:hypothetical protein